MTDLVRFHDMEFDMMQFLNLKLHNLQKCCKAKPHKN